MKDARVLALEILYDLMRDGWQFAACGCCLEPAKQEQSK